MRLRGTIQKVLEGIEEQCGLVGFFVIGGPEPQRGGNLMVFSCVIFMLFMSQQQTRIVSRAHTGLTKHGHNFSETYNKWNTHVEQAFNLHLDKVFRASVFFFVNIH